MGSVSRRGFLVGAGAAGAATVGRLPLARAATSVLGAAKPASSGPSIVGVTLEDRHVPIPPNLAEVCHFCQAWLDQQAQEYWTNVASGLTRPLNSYDKADFWFRYLAIPLQRKALLGDSFALPRDKSKPDGSIEQDLALIHLVGYLGGIWFGKKMDEFVQVDGHVEQLTGTDPNVDGPAGNDTTASCADPAPEPGEADFAAMADSLRKAIDAVRNADDRAVLALAEETIRGGDAVFYLTNGLPTLNGAIGSYAYNVGYCNAILVPDNRALPPPLNPSGGPSPYNPPWNSFIGYPGSVFDATYPVWADPATAKSIQPLPPNPDGTFTPVPYLIGDVDGLKIARAWLDDARTNPATAPEYNRIVEGRVDRDGNNVNRGDLRALSEASFNTGAAFWTAVPTLNLRLWDEPSFNLINSLSIFFLQAVQVAGASLLAAAARGDADRARRALMAYNVSLPFGASYLVSLNRGTSGDFACWNADDSVPPFVFSDGSIGPGPLTKPAA